MTATFLDGKKLAGQMTAAIRDDVQRLARLGLTPHLVSILVQDDPGAVLYVNRQREKCRELGIKYTLFHMSDDISEEELISHIESVNLNPGVTGVILQLPLPKAMDSRRVQARLDQAKDVEGMSPPNLGHLVRGTGSLLPCTALGIVELLRSARVPLRGQDVVVVGHSEIVGKPLALMLLDEGCTTTVCHIDTRDLARHTREADILVSATGRPHLITQSMVKPGAIVIDVGVSKVQELDSEGNPARDSDGKVRQRVVGDVDTDAVKEIAAVISPHRGGVGPMTVTMLLRNTVVAARAALDAKPRS